MTEAIYGWMRSGRLAPGDRLPSERALAQELKMNHLTVRRGLADLVSRGLIEKRRNVGSFVATSSAPLTVGIVLPDHAMNGSVQHPYFSQMFNGIQSALSPREYAITTLGYRPGCLWEDAGAFLTERRAGGVLLSAGVDVQEDDARKLLDAGMEVVLLKANRRLCAMGLSCVDTDTETALAQILKRCHELGHRRIVVAEYTQGAGRSAHLEVIEDAAARWRWGDPAALRLDVPNEPGGGPEYSVLDKLFSGEGMPTALIVPDEFAASAVFRRCWERRIRVPEDLSVAAVVDSTPDLHPVALSACDGSALARAVGRTAAEHLRDALGGHRRQERRVHLRCDVQFKKSLAAPTAVESDRLAVPSKT